MALSHPPFHFHVSHYILISISLSLHVLSFPLSSGSLFFLGDIKTVIDIAKWSSFTFVLRFFFPSVQPQFTHFISSISLFFTSIHTVEHICCCADLECLWPCVWNHVEVFWLLKPMRERGDETKSCHQLPFYSQPLLIVCVSPSKPLISQCCCEEVCFVCVGTYWRYHCHVFTCIKEKHSSLCNGKLSWPNFCANESHWNITLIHTVDVKKFCLLFTTARSCIARRTVLLCILLKTTSAESGELVFTKTTKTTAEPLPVTFWQNQVSCFPPSIYAKLYWPAGYWL